MKGSPSTRVEGRNHPKGPKYLHGVWGTFIKRNYIDIGRTGRVIWVYIGLIYGLIGFRVSESQGSLFWGVGSMGVRIISLIIYFAGYMGDPKFETPASALGPSWDRDRRTHKKVLTPWIKSRQPCTAPCAGFTV